MIAESQDLNLRRGVGGETSWAPSCTFIILEVSRNGKDFIFQLGLVKWYSQGSFTGSWRCFFFRSYTVLHFHCGWDNRAWTHSTQTSQGVKPQLTPSGAPSFQLSPQQGPKQDPASTDHQESLPRLVHHPANKSPETTPSLTHAGTKNADAHTDRCTREHKHWKHTLLKGTQLSADCFGLFWFLIGLCGLWERPIYWIWRFSS